MKSEMTLYSESDWGLQIWGKNLYLPGHLSFHAVRAADNASARPEHGADSRGGSRAAFGGIGTAAFRGALQPLVVGILIVTTGDVPVLEGVHGAGELPLGLGSRDPPAGVGHCRGTVTAATACVTPSDRAQRGSEGANAASPQPRLGPARGSGLTMCALCTPPVPRSHSAGDF